MPKLDHLPLPTRRRVVRRSLQLVGLALMGCSPKDADDGGTDSGGLADGGTGDGGSDGGTGDGGTGDGGTGDGGSTDCPDPLEGGELIDVLEWEGETARDLEELSGSGLDARYVLDLTTLESDSLVVDTERFFVRTGLPIGRPDPADWSIAVGGLIDDASLRLDDLLPLAEDQGIVLLECSGNTDYGGFGLMSAARWEGIPVAAVFELIGDLPEGARVLVQGNDEHGGDSGSSSTQGCAWIFTVDDLIDAGAFFATGMNGDDLPDDHGHPVRLVVPGWYGCCSVKWVDAIQIVPDDEPATSQMQEFASRTHQSGTPSLARDYIPATIDLTAAPIRVEQWLVDGVVRYRVVGLVWGGTATGDAASALTLEVEGDSLPVDVCPARDEPRTWALWSVLWDPAESGDYDLTLSCTDSAVVTRRLDSGWYDRRVSITEPAG